MKKFIKPILLGIAAIIILFLGLGLIYYSPAFTMKVASTGKIDNTNIYAVKNGMGNIYFVKTDSGYIMIDAGLETKGFQKSLKEIGISANDVKWIFLTHSDSDHTGTLPLLPNAKIYMSEDEFPLINGTKKRFAFMNNTMPPGIDIKKIILLYNGQKMSINGTEIVCIKAPGHTDGSMLYMIDDKYLFTGDAFKIRNGSTSVHPYTINSNLAKETIEHSNRIINSSTIVLTSHYGFHYITKL